MCLLFIGAENILAKRRISYKHYEFIIKPYFQQRSILLEEDFEMGAGNSLEPMQFNQEETLVNNKIVIRTEPNEDHLVSSQSRRVIKTEPNEDHLVSSQSRRVIKTEPNEDHLVSSQSRRVIKTEPNENFIQNDVNNQEVNSHVSSPNRSYNLNDTDIFETNNNKLYITLNSFEYPYYLYEFYPDLFANLKHDLNVNFNARLIKLDKKYLIEARFKSRNVSIHNDKWKAEIRAYLKSFNGHNFFTYSHKDMNGDDWDLIKNILIQKYAKSNYLCLILEEMPSYSFRIDGRKDLVETEKGILLKELSSLDEARSKIDKNKLDSASSCLVS